MKEFKLGVWLVSIVAIVALAGIAFALTTNNDKDSKKAKKEKNKKGKSANMHESESSPCIKGQLSVKQQWELPSELKEVSAITYLSDNRIAAVQDQLGTIFIYDLSTSKVIEKLNFGPEGDYEGLVHHDADFYIVRSDGQLTHADAKGKVIKVYDLPLSESDNIESLALDIKNNRLLLGQKDGEKGRQLKKIFAFDLKTKSLSKAPALQIDYEQIIASCGSGATEKGKGKKSKKGDDVRPSEMIIDPKNGDILIADGPSSRIFVVDNNGKFKHILTLDKKRFPQAEGLAFDPNGELYVSSEGTKNPAIIAHIEGK